jgi:type I restriction enzyme M protein
LIDPFEPEFSEDGRIIDFITGDYLDNRPEELVRQRLQRLLHIQHGYPKNRIAREIPIYYGGKELRDTGGKPVRADVGVFRTVAAARKKDQGQIQIVCETKQPKRKNGYNQLVSYIFNTSADGAIWFNSEDLRVWRRVENKLYEWPTLPRLREAWDAVGRRRKNDLIELKDPRGTLRRCHDRIHKRGVTEDVAITMVRLLLAKWRDEERPGEFTEFYCTPEEYRTREGREAVAKRIETLFAEVRDENPTVFDEFERVGASSDEIVEVVTELQHFRLLGESDKQWDIMGAAYEQYTADEMKKEGGEFFTNRLIVDLLTRMVLDTPLSGVMLDPAGGTGGFCSSVLRHTRKLIRQTISSRSAQERAIEHIKNKIFLIDKKPRLVKLAKAAMIVSGNGHRGFIQADALEPFASLPEHFVEECKPNRVTVVMTNPPWSGLINGRITDTLLLQHYDVAHRWEWTKGRFMPGADLVSGGIPPEYLFVEKCIEWLSLDGILSIVLPKGILDNMEPALAVRHYLFRHCRVLAVVNCHKNTFQPYTGSRGCLIIAKKKRKPNDSRNYNIFMAINRKIGQDSEGVPVYKKDDRGRPTHDLDQDLDIIYEAWQDHLRGHLKESEYIFAINANKLDHETLKLNPQFFLPSYNKTLQHIVSLDGNGFTVERLGDRIASQIWKGSRFKREDIEVDSPNESTVKYMTPTSIFMRGEGVKYYDLSKCDSRRRQEILRHRAKEGEILITRSGTLGRVTIVGRSLRDVILSDDLIRIWVEDPKLRALVFAFLRSPGGQDQLRRNEYGTVQQHLEPSHVADVQLPLPDDHQHLKKLMSTVASALEAFEESITMEAEADKQMLDLLRLINN